MEFVPYDSLTHQEAESVVQRLPQPVEVKQLDKKWCVRITKEDGTPLATIGKTVEAACIRMLTILHLNSN